MCIRDREQIEAITQEVRGLVSLQYSTYTRSLLPALKQNGLHVIQEHEALTKEEARYVDRYFRDNVYPVLTPMAVDSSRPCLLYTSAQGIHLCDDPALASVFRMLLLSLD